MRAVASGVIAAGLVAGFLLFGSVSGGNGGAPTSARDVPVQLLQPYDSSFINLWIRGCVSSGQSDAFCRCAIDVFTTRLRTDEFEALSAVAQSGGQPSELPDNTRAALAVVERDCG
jgi:hypothetical protein